MYWTNQVKEVAMNPKTKEKMDKAIDVFCVVALVSAVLFCAITLTWAEIVL